MKIIHLAIVTQSAIFELRAENGSIQVEARLKNETVYLVGLQAHLEKHLQLL